MFVIFPGCKYFRKLNSELEFTVLCFVFSIEGRSAGAVGLLAEPTALPQADSFVVLVCFSLTN